MCRRMIYLVSLALMLGLGLTVGVAGASEVKINFQSVGAPIPDGYLPEYGDPFFEHDDGWSYGWDQNIRSGARDRNNANAPDQRYDTLNHLQQAELRMLDQGVPIEHCGAPHVSRLENLEPRLRGATHQVLGQDRLDVVTFVEPRARFGVVGQWRAIQQLAQLQHASHGKGQVPRQRWHTRRRERPQAPVRCLTATARAADRP